MSGVAVCTAWTIAINVLRLHIFSVGDSLELSRIQFTLPRQTQHRQDCFVGSGMAVGTYRPKSGKIDEVGL